jgi:hypothetical protein
MGIMQAAIVRARSVDPVVNVTNQTPGDFHSVASPSVATASASYEVNANGQLYLRQLRDGDVTVSGEWLTAGAAGDVEVLAQSTAGAAPDIGDVLNAWLNCGTTRSWGWTATQAGGGADSSAGTLSVQFRRASDGAALDSCTVTGAADAEVT